MSRRSSRMRCPWCRAQPEIAPHLPRYSAAVETSSLVRTVAAVASLLVAAAAPACSERSASRSGEPRAATSPQPPPWIPSAIAHCGAGTPVARGGGCQDAVDAALALLERGGEPLDAAVAGVVRLEDDPRYNAGIG